MSYCLRVETALHMKLAKWTLRHTGRECAKSNIAGVLTKGKIQIDTHRGMRMCARIEAESKAIQQKPRNIKDCLNQKSGKAWGTHSLQEGTILPLEARLHQNMEGVHFW